MSDLKEKTIKGLFWSAMSQGGRQIVQLVVTAILARLLSPSDFGLVAMATVFMNFANIFAELGMSSAIIQKHNIKEEHLSSAFWLNITAGIILTLIFISISPLIAKFYGKPKLNIILFVMSFNFILMSFTIIQKSILRKEMNFYKLALRETATTIISGFFAIYLAYIGFGVWSLVYQLLLATLIDNILLWGISNWRPKFIFSMQAIRDIFRFGMHLTSFNIVTFFARNIDQLLIGKFLGDQALGYYSLAYKIMLYPVHNVSGVINKVIFPAFSKIQNDFERIRANYLKVIKAIALVTFPMMGIFFVIAPEFVKIFLGPKWAPAIIVIQILSLCGLVQSVGGPIAGNIRLSQGRTDMHLRIGVLNTVLAVAAILVGLRWGIIGVSISYTIFSVGWAFYTNLVTLPLIHLNLTSYISTLRVPAVSTFFVIFLLLIFKPAFIFGQTLKIAIVGISGVILYSLSLLYFGEISIKNNKFSFNFLNSTQ